MIAHLWAFLTDGRVVWLRDYDGTITRSIAYKDPWGKLTAYRYWIMRIRMCELMEDGSIKNGYYVEAWKYAE